MLIKVTIVTPVSASVPAMRMAPMSAGSPQYPRKLSENPTRYRLTLKDRPTKSASPRVPPTGRPRLREMM